MLYRYLISHKCMFSNITNTIQLVITKVPYQVLLYGKDILDMSISIISKNFCFVGYCYPVFLSLATSYRTV